VSYQTLEYATDTASSY